MREAEISEARGSHCRPLRRANSATRRRISSFAVRALSKCAKASATAPPMLEPQRKSTGKPSSSSTSSTPRWARPAAAPTLMATPTSRPQSRRTRWSSAGWRSRDQSLPEAPASISSRASACDQRCRAAAAESGPRRQTTGWASACGRPGRSSSATSSTSSASRSRSRAATARDAGAEQQHRVAVPFLAPAAHAPGSRCGVVARHRVVLRAGRVVVQAPAQCGQQDAVDLLPDRQQHDSRPARRRAPRALAQAHAQEGGHVAEEGGLLRHRLEQDRGRKHPGLDVAMGDDGGRDRIAGQRRQLAEALRRHQLHPAAAVAQLDPHRALDQAEQLGRSDAGAQDDVARLEVAYLQVPLDLLERRDRHVGEERMQRQRRCQRYFCQSELLKRPCGSTRDLSWRICATSG